MKQFEESLRAAVHRKHVQIAIDGPAGSGKSTVGLGLAKRLASPMLDTGLMYRAVAWLALRHSFSSSDADALSRIASSTRFTVSPDGVGLVVNGTQVTEELQSPAVDQSVSAVSALAAVRSALVDQQRRIADSRAIVMVGRDIGTVVLPDAQVKLWVTAGPLQRAKRRIGQRRDARPLEVVASEIERRDRLDSTRAVSPLRKADDAVELVTDDEPVRVTLERAMEIVRSKVRTLEETKQ